MTNEEIANELQGINGLLMEAEGRIHKAMLNISRSWRLGYVLDKVRSARALIVEEAQLLEPPLKISEKGMKRALKLLSETPHPPANRSKALRKKMLESVERVEASLIESPSGAKEGDLPTASELRDMSRALWKGYLLRAYYGEFWEVKK